MVTVVNGTGTLRTNDPTSARRLDGVRSERAEGKGARKVIRWASMSSDSPRSLTSVNSTPGVVAIGGKVSVRNYCHGCGKPYAWTRSKIIAALAMADEVDGLTDAERVCS